MIERDICGICAVILLAATMIQASCTGIASAPETCLAPKLAPIEAARITEAVSRCDKKIGWEKCPVREEIDHKYDELRAAAIKECE